MSLEELKTNEAKRAATMSSIDLVTELATMAESVEVGLSLLPEDEATVSALGAELRRRREPAALVFVQVLDADLLPASLRAPLARVLWESMTDGERVNAIGNLGAAFNVKRDVSIELRSVVDALVAELGELACAIEQVRVNIESLDPSGGPRLKAEDESSTAAYPLEAPRETAF